jgi:signal transduction histidine kinase/ActR/RegA family two-component response regulator
MNAVTTGISLWILALGICPAAAAQPVLRMGYEHSPPAQLVDKTGQISGPVYEVLSKAAELRKIRLEWIYCPEGPDRALKSAKVDLWPLLADIPERRAAISVTQPYFRSRFWLIAREESGIRTIGDIQGRQVLRQPGVLAEMLAKRYLHGARIEEGPSLTRNMELVCRGEVEAVLVAQGTGDHILLRDKGCDVGRMHVIALPGVQLDFGIGAKRGDRRAELAAATLKQALVELFDDGQMAGIWLRWGLIVTETRMLADFLSAQRYNRLLLSLSALLLLALAVALWQTLRWRRARAAAEAAAEAKQSFLANMSHEIRTPMNGVLGLAGLLEDSGLPAEQRQQARIIRQSAAALLRLLNDVLDVAKIEAGKFQLIEAPFDLRELVDQVAHLAAPQAEAKGLEWKLDWAEDLPAHWIGDGARIRQILLNLTGNAVKFTRLGWVRLAVHHHADGVRFRVEDTGPGIAPQLRVRLFETFIQGEQSLSTGMAGSGLGLAISRSLVERMGGGIRLDTELGIGSTFTVTLPLRETAQPDASSAARRTAGTPGEGKLVLVVEDNHVNQYVAQRMLGRLGCAVEIAADGGEALARLARARYDMVFMDCGLPGMDGYEVTRVFRERENGTGHTPVIALTAAALEGDRERCLAAGMDDYLTKPLDLEVLARAVARWAAPEAETVRRSGEC